MLESLIQGLHNLYVFGTIFGAGVTAVDMLGILGHGHDGSHDGAGHDGDVHHAGETHDAAHNGGASLTLLSVLRYLRMFVYFMLGFGPTGLIAEAMGTGILQSFFWAVPVGVASTVLARLFFRFQQKDLDSSVRDEDLLYEQATVIVPISGGNMGKVRIRTGQMVSDRYALAENADDVFRRDDVVEIVRVTPESVVVRGVEAVPSLDAPS